MANTMFRLKFGTPIHGWLPVRIEYDSGSLEFEASDVPYNPVQELVESLELINKGYEKEIWWHLEPAGYYLKFTPQGDELLIEIEFSNNFRSNDRRKIVELAVAKVPTLLAIWREIRRFQSLKFEDRNWPNLDDNQVVQIGASLKNSVKS